MGRLWETNKDISKKILNFTVGKDNKLDERLIKYDIIGTIAHVKMLKEIGILNEDEKEKIIKALNELLSKKQIKISKSEEDSHTKIENYLVKKLGDVGKKVHTARSRNDQVVTALRLYYKDSLKRIKLQTRKLIKTLKTLRKEYGDAEIPGFTHYRKATPTTVDVWLGSFIESLEDDLRVFKSIEYLIDQNPLGSGAGYGVPNIKVDRTITQKELKFKRIQENPLYVQNSRGKFESAIAFALSMILFDINKLSSDIILFSEEDFGFVKLDKQITTGSSMMPNKFNPDVFEIARANYNKVISLELMLRMLPANLISGYHRDLQLTKEAILEIIDTAESTIDTFSYALKHISIDKNRAQKLITDEMRAVERVNESIKSGIPFREAYKNEKRKIEKQL